MDNADCTKYSSIKLDYLFCTIGITLVNADRKKVWDKCRETNLGHYLFHIGINIHRVIWAKQKKSFPIAGKDF